MMTTNCAHCQQPLHPSWGAQFMTCPHCGGYVELFEANGQLYSLKAKTPAAPAQTTAPVPSPNLEAKRQALQNEMMILQQQWLIEQPKYTFKGRLPERRMNIKLYGLLFGAFILLNMVFIGYVLYYDSEEDLDLFGFLTRASMWLILIMIIFFTIVIPLSKNASAYFDALEKFEQAKARIQAQLNELDQ